MASTDHFGTNQNYKELKAKSKAEAKVEFIVLKALPSHS